MTRSSYRTSPAAHSRGLRRIGLDQTKFGNATCGSIRLKLLKIGALVSISVRRIKFAMASSMFSPAKMFP